jgi:hypothetical protein
MNTYLVWFEQINAQLIEVKANNDARRDTGTRHHLDGTGRDGLKQ